MIDAFGPFSSGGVGRDSSWMAEVVSEHWSSVVTGVSSGIHHLPFAFSGGNSVTGLIINVNIAWVGRSSGRSSSGSPLAESSDWKYWLSIWEEFSPLALVLEVHATIVVVDDLAGVSSSDCWGDLGLANVFWSARPHAGLVIPV